MLTKDERRRSIEIGRGRTLSIEKRVRTHPCRKKNLKDFIDDEKKLSRIMGKLVMRKSSDVRIAGFSQRSEYGGRPQNVYACHRTAWANHDSHLTDVFEALGWPEVHRGLDVPKINDVRADALTPFPRRRLWEMCMETERLHEYERKNGAYAGEKIAVLFVGLTEAGLRKIMAWTEPLADVAFYALYSDLISNPTGEVWRSASGARKALSFAELPGEKQAEKVA